MLLTENGCARLRSESSRATCLGARTYSRIFIRVPGRRLQLRVPGLPTVHHRNTPRSHEIQKPPSEAGREAPLNRIRESVRGSLVWPVEFYYRATPAERPLDLPLAIEQVAWPQLSGDFADRRVPGGATGKLPEVTTPVVLSREEGILACPISCDSRGGPLVPQMRRPRLSHTNQRRPGRAGLRLAVSAATVPQGPNSLLSFSPQILGISRFV